ncbi:PE-PPE domain-containing protein [Mycobacterium sp. NPDC003323]
MSNGLGFGFVRSAVVALTLSLGFWLVAPPGSAGAVTALMMGGTTQPYPDRVNGYMDTTSRRYLDPVSPCKVSTCTLQPVYIPNEASPIYTDGMAFGPSVVVGTGLLEAAVRLALAQTDEQIVVFGNSQSATVATEVKRLLGADATVDKSRLSFVMIGNPNRPNGGFMQRFFPGEVPIFEYVPKGTPANDTGMTTTDIAFHYDIAADFPRYPLNLLAVLNVFVGMAVHGAYDDKVNPNGYTEEELQAQINDPKNRIVIGDTTYVTIPTKVLPLAQAIRGIGHSTGTSAILTPLADLLEPVLRVLVELGYDRSTPAAVQRSFGLLPAVNPLKVLKDLGDAIGQGVHDMVTNIAARQRGTSGQQPTEPATTAPEPSAALQFSPQAELEPASRRADLQTPTIDDDDADDREPIRTLDTEDRNTDLLDGSDDDGDTAVDLLTGSGAGDDDASNSPARDDDETVTDGSDDDSPEEAHGDDADADGGTGGDDEPSEATPSQE